MFTYARFVVPTTRWCNRRGPRSDRYQDKPTGVSKQSLSLFLRLLLVLISLTIGVFLFSFFVFLSEFLNVCLQLASNPDCQSWFLPGPQRRSQLAVAHISAVSSVYLPGTSGVKAPASFRDPKDHINIRILQTMDYEIPQDLGVGTRMQDPDVHMVFRALLVYEHGAYPHMCGVKKHKIMGSNHDLVGMRGPFWGPASQPWIIRALSCGFLVWVGV